MDVDMKHLPNLEIECPTCHGKDNCNFGMCPDCTDGTILTEEGRRLLEFLAKYFKRRKRRG